MKGKTTLHIVDEEILFLRMLFIEYVYVLNPDELDNCLEFSLDLIFESNGEIFYESDNNQFEVVMNNYVQSKLKKFKLHKISWGKENLLYFVGNFFNEISRMFILDKNYDYSSNRKNVSKFFFEPQLLNINEVKGIISSLGFLILYKELNKISINFDKFLVDPMKLIVAFFEENNYPGWIQYKLFNKEDVKKTNVEIVCQFFKYILFVEFLKNYHSSQFDFEENSESRTKIENLSKMRRDRYIFEYSLSFRWYPKNKNIAELKTELYHWVDEIIRESKSRLISSGYSQTNVIKNYERDIFWLVLSKINKMSFEDIVSEDFDGIDSVLDYSEFVGENFYEVTPVVASLNEDSRIEINYEHTSSNSGREEPHDSSSISKCVNSLAKKIGIKF